ncbi:MAG: helix-turn-helix domain-containing protein, partial [Candidatus Thorarchaeota archaeon]|nr:helix-turn-helix domain-containing protein [Candidatus Thorarchaeota archaeon]
MTITRKNLISVEVNNGEVDEIVKIFKALADQTRIRIISLLTKADRFNVSELAELLAMDISRISHQLTKLEHMG